jgi:hypothetical protein
MGFDWPLRAVQLAKVVVWMASCNHSFLCPFVAMYIEASCMLLHLAVLKTA